MPTRHGVSSGAGVASGSPSSQPHSLCEAERSSGLTRAGLSWKARPCPPAPWSRSMARALRRQTILPGQLPSPGT
eukprot:10070874-Alexandrium_andersonii.AAC.1